MFKSISTRILQHLIAQNTWACGLLQPYAGKSIRIVIAPVSSTLIILENGSLAAAGETNIHDACIKIAPSLLPRLIAKDESAKLQIEISGDTHLATILAKVMAHMHWDYEDDLSKLVGDIPANKISTYAKNKLQHFKDTSINIAEMLSEYWQEESPMLAKKRHVEQFNSDVDSLRSDAERLEKKLLKLTKSIATSASEMNKSSSKTTSMPPHNSATDSVK